jgi:hypothetical protein
MALAVDAYKLTYSTLDPRGSSATATEGIFVPSGSDPRCQGNRPVVVYAHGTARHKSFNMADISCNGATETFNNP